MGLMQTRDSIVSYLNPLLTVAHPEVAVVYDNQSFDHNSPPPMFLEIRIEMSGGEQMDLGLNPNTRYRGMVFAVITVREGLGSRAALNVLDTVSSLLKYKVVDSVQFSAPQPSFERAPVS